MPDILPVIFRADKYGPTKGAVTAVFPTEFWSERTPLTIFDGGAHGGADVGWYLNQTRPATDKESAELLAQLRQLYAPEYELRVYRRMARQHRAARLVQERRSLEFRI
jgi:hypothetical protein